MFGLLWPSHKHIRTFVSAPLLQWLKLYLQFLLKLHLVALRLLPNHSALAIEHTASLLIAGIASGHLAVYVSVCALMF